MLSQRKLISNQVLNKLQAFHFRSTCTMHTNTTPAVTTHSYVLQIHRSATIMVIKIELKIVTKSASQSVFGQKR